MKTNLDFAFKTDKTSEEQGVWFDVSDKTGFLVRRFSDRNPKVAASMAKHYKPFAKQMSIPGAMPPEKQREILINIFVDVCLADWRGVEIDGEDKGFEKETAKKLMVEYPDLFNALYEHSQKFENYQDQAAVEELGNS